MFISIKNIIKIFLINKKRWLDFLSKKSIKKFEKNFEKKFLKKFEKNFMKKFDKN